ncbi:MAG TPA: DMT family transporter [Segeticoccus sp.]|uniref:DMT family transporter n=1 Tax=Segeticoccus sp. TaxID=2706531 RepID=UPI002D7F5F57|nr:DMT family transporter [Segeticoccus sp.]HET8598692.1 DMT family transporter [Segeticoccus sp.]
MPPAHRSRPPEDRSREHTAPAEHGRVVTLAALATLVGGALLSVQSQLNGQLSLSWGAPTDAALWSFSSGLVVLTALLLAVPGARRALLSLPGAVRRGELRWWQCLGGFAGAAYVAVQTYAVPLAGVAVFTIAVVGGQTGNSLLVDRLGLSPAGHRPVTVGRLLAAAVAVVGVAVAVSGQHGGTGPSVILPAVLAFVVGACTTVQQATNGQVNATSGSSVATGWLNFATGLCFLVVVALVRLVTAALHSPADLSAPWWAWLGGVLGVPFIVISAVVVQYLGMLLYTLVMLTGQLATAVALDLVAPTGTQRIGIQVVVGVVITLLAAYAAAWAAQRRPPAGRPG